MTSQLIGYEGRALAGSPVTWGAAAIKEADGTLFNSVTGRRTSMKRWPELVDAGQVTELEHPLPLVTGHDLPFIVLDIDPAAAAAPFVTLKQKHVQGVVLRGESQGRQIVAFGSSEAFDDYCALISSEIARAALAEPSLTLDSIEAINVGLVVSPRDPILNALRICCLPAERRERAMTVSKHHPWTDKERERFEDVLNALGSDETEYGLDYEGGVTQGGGVDLEFAHLFFRSAHKAHTTFAPAIRLIHPYLGSVPSARFDNFASGSARFRFRTVVEGQPLGDRLARFMELKLLEHALRGDQLPSEVDVKKLRGSVSWMRSPDAETTVSHKRLSGAEEQLTAPRTDDALPRRDEVIAVLAYESGVIDHGDQVQLTLFPGVAKMLSTRDNGDGEEPLGASSLTAENLYSWSLCTILVQGKGNPPYVLKRVESAWQFVDGGEARLITAIPSAVVRGAFIVGLLLPLRLVNSQLRIDGLSTQLSYFAGGDAARETMLDFERACQAFELSLAERRINHKYFMPRDVVVTDKHRLLTALHELGGSGSFREIVLQYETLFRKPLARRGFSRAVGLSFNDVEEREGVYQLTDSGKRVARCCAAALRTSIDHEGSLQNRSS